MTTATCTSNLPTAYRLAARALRDAAGLYREGAITPEKHEYYQANADRTALLQACVPVATLLARSGRTPDDIKELLTQYDAEAVHDQIMSEMPAQQRLAWTTARGHLANVEPYTSDQFITARKQADPYGWDLAAPSYINDNLLPEGEHRLKAILEWLEAAAGGTDHHATRYLNPEQ